MDIYSIYKLLLRKKWLIIIIPIITGILAVLFTFLMPKEYKSFAKLSTGYTTQEGINLEDESFDFSKSVLKFDNLIETMKSEMILSMVSYELLLHDLSDSVSFRMDPDSISYYKQKNDFSVIEDKMESFTILSTANPNDLKIRNILKKYDYLGWQLNKDLLIYRINGTDFIKVEFASEDPFLSAFVVNKLTKHLIRYLNYKNILRTNTAVQFFQKEVDKKKSFLDKTIQKVNIARANGPISDESGTSSISTKLAQYELLKEESIRKISEYEYSLEIVNSQLATNKSTANATLNQKIVDLRERINKLTQLYMESGSNDEATQQKITTLQNQLTFEMKLLESPTDEKARKKNLEDKKEEFSILLVQERANLKRLTRLITDTENKAELASVKVSNLKTLENQLENALTEYQTAMDRLNLEKNKALLAESNVAVVVAAQPQLEPESSKKKIIVGFAVMASFSFVVFIIIGIEYLDQRIKTPSRFKNFARLNLLGSIENVGEQQVEMSTILKHAKRKKIGKDRNDQLLRKIRYEIENSDAKSYLFTSMKAGEGKTFVILSLSYSLSLIGKRTLIIDTNFKNNTLTNVLINTNDAQKRIRSNNSQLALLGNARDERKEFENSFITHTFNPYVDIIGNKSGMGSPSEIFAGKNFNQFMVIIKSEYDYIFMEGAALNEYSDTKELALFADKIIPVFSAESSLKSDDLESIEYLKSLNGKLGGSILNLLDPKIVV